MPKHVFFLKLMFVQVVSHSFPPQAPPPLHSPLHLDLGTHYAAWNFRT